MEEAVRSGYGALGAAIELEHKRAAARMRKPRKRLQRAARSLAERLPQRLLPLVCAVVLVVAMASYRATRASPHDVAVAGLAERQLEVSRFVRSGHVGADENRGTQRVRDGADACGRASGR